MKLGFLSTVKHKMGSLLTIVKESVNIVLEEAAGPLNAEQKSYLDTAKRNIENLIQLSNDFFDLQKLDSGEMEFSLQPNNIEPLLEEVKSKAAPSAKNKGFNLLLKADSNLPEAVFDRDKISRVLTAIIGIATRLSEKGEIKIYAAKAANQIEIAIESAGFNLLKENPDVALTKFAYQGSDNEQKEGGIGLELALAKKIIEKHKGKIRIEKSQPDKEARICFSLPLS